MPIQPTNFFGMNQQLGRDIGNIPGSIVQGAKQGAELGLMFDKFRKAEDDQKAFQEVKSDFMRQIRTDMADDPRGQRILALATRARSMPEIAGLAKELIVAQNAEKTTKSKLKFDANMLAHDGGGELYAKMAKEQETKAEAEAKKAETEAAGQSARQKAEQPGFDPKQLSKQEWEQQGSQLKESADQAYKREQLQLQKDRLKLEKMKQTADAGRNVRMEINEALRLMNNAKSFVTEARIVKQNAQAHFNKLQKDMGAFGSTVSPEQFKEAKENLKKAGTSEENEKDWVKILKKVIEQNNKDIRGAKAQAEMARLLSPNQPIQTSVNGPAGPMQAPEGYVSPVRAPIQQPTALPGTTAVAGTPPRRRGTGFAGR